MGPLPLLLRISACAGTIFTLTLALSLRERGFFLGAAGAFLVLAVLLLLVVLPGVEAGLAAYALTEVSHPIFFLPLFLLALLLAALSLLLALDAAVCL